MKRIILFFFTIYFFSPLFSQQEFAPIGAKWYVNEKIDHYYYGFGDPLIDYYVIESKGDTLIDGTLYRRVGDDLFYQDGDQIYYLKNASLHLIYDFDVSVGDTLTFEMLGCDYSEIDNIFEVKVIVSAVDVIEIDGQLLKQVTCDWLTWDSVYDNYPYVYIEKIGSLRISVEDYVFCEFGYPPLLPFLRCYQDEDISFQTPRFLAEGGEQCDQITSNTEAFYQPLVKCYPNPFQSQLFVESSYTEEIEVQLYNTFGQLVAQAAGEGIISLEIAHLPSGHYYASLRNAAGQFLAGQVVVKN